MLKKSDYLTKEEDEFLHDNISTQISQLKQQLGNPNSFIKKNIESKISIIRREDEHVDESV